MVTQDTNNVSWITPDRLKYEIVNHPAYERYLEWKACHRHVYMRFEQLTLDLLRKKRRFGMWLVANRIRWEHVFEYDSDFKISNDYTALITRELMLKHPQMVHHCRIKKMNLGGNIGKTGSTIHQNIK